MKNSFHLFLVCIFVTQISSNVNASRDVGLESQKISGSKSWKDCLAFAKSDSPALTAALENFRSVKEAEKAARSGYFPQVSASLSDSQISTGSPATRSETGLAQLSLTQNLFSGFSDHYKTEQAKHNSEQAEADLALAKAQILSDLRGSAAQLIYAQDSVGLTQKIKLRRLENMKIVSLRFAGGRENKGAVLLSEAYFQSAEFDEQQAQLQTQNARTQLAGLLGQTADESFALTDGPEPVEIDEKGPINFEALSLQSPTYKKAVAAEESALSGLDQLRSNFFPSLDFSAAAGKSDTQFFPNSDRWSLGLTLSIPIFSGWKDMGNYGVQAARWKSALAVRHEKIHLQLNQLKQGFSDLLLSKKKVQVDEKFRDASRVRSSIARSKYNNGLMSFDDWDSIESDLIQREKNLLASRRDRMLAEAAWELAQGKGLLE